MKVTIATEWTLGEWGDGGGSTRERVWSLVGADTRQVAAFITRAFGGGWTVRVYDPDGASLVLLDTLKPTEAEAKAAADAALAVWAHEQGGSV